MNHHFITLNHLIWFKFLVEAIVLGDKVCTPLQLPGTCEVSGHFGAKSVLPVSDQLVGGLHHFITGLLEGVPGQSHVLQDMAVHDMDLKI